MSENIGLFIAVVVGGLCLNALLSPDDSDKKVMLDNPHIVSELYPLWPGYFSLALGLVFCIRGELAVFLGLLCFAVGAGALAGAMTNNNGIINKYRDRS